MLFNTISSYFQGQTFTFENWNDRQKTTGEKRKIYVNLLEEPGSLGQTPVEKRKLWWEKTKFH